MGDLESPWHYRPLITLFLTNCERLELGTRVPRGDADAARPAGTWAAKGAENANKASRLSD